MAGRSQYFSYLSLDPLAPVPESSPHSYTPEKVEERLKYVRERMKERNITPRSEIFLQLYQEAAESALEVTSEASRNSCCTRLYRYDRFIQENSFLCEERTSAQKELEEKLLKLKRLEYYVRYGDYLARELSILKDTATTLQTDNHRELQQYWTTIADEMKAEKKVFNQRSGKTGPEDIPTLLAIWAAAAAVKLSRGRVECLIENYAERNTLVHSGVTQLMQAGHWSQLATNLYHDAKDLLMVIPPGMEEDIENMSAVISSLRARYFIIDEGDEDDPDTWRANEEAVRYRHALRAETDAKNKKKAEIVEEMVQRAGKAAEKRAKQAELVENAILGKRKASQTFPLGEEMLAKKSKEMEKVVGIQLQVTRKESELDNLYRTREKAVDALGNLGEAAGEVGDAAEDAVSAMGYLDVEG
ncbi:MAG: hypothetical protein M1839_005354 [Geoglossum umbratile]|nr:MAG: hypothetical protein M1839_005354 [Geoglossum umbratile]